LTQKRKLNIHFYPLKKLVIYIWWI